MAKSLDEIAGFDVAETRRRLRDWLSENPLAEEPDPWDESRYLAVGGLAEILEFAEANPDEARLISIWSVPHNRGVRPEYDPEAARIAELRFLMLRHAEEMEHAARELRDWTNREIGTNWDDSYFRDLVSPRDEYKGIISRPAFGTEQPARAQRPWYALVAAEALARHARGSAQGLMTGSIEWALKAREDGFGPTPTHFLDMVSRVLRVAGFRTKTIANLIAAGAGDTEARLRQRLKRLSVLPPKETD